MIIADTSGLLAAFGRDQPDHARTRAAFEADPGPIVMSPYILAELDYHLMERGGIDAELRDQARKRRRNLDEMGGIGFDDRRQHQVALYFLRSNRLDGKLAAHR